MFNLSFLNAGILFLSLAAIIPLLIHLFSKQKPQKIYFSSLKFIKESLKERQKNIRLKNLLIIIIRMLIILFTILGISRPAIKTSLHKSSQSHSETAVAIIIDNSFSMDYLVDSETEFEKAKNIHQQINQMLTDKDIQLIISRDLNWNSIHSRMIYGKAPKDELKDLNLTFMPITLNECIEKANSMLLESNYLNKEIYVLSDFQNEGKINQSEIPVFFIPTSQTKQRTNISCKNPLIISSHQNLYTKELQFTVKNHGIENRDDVIYKIYLNGNQTSEKMISLAPNQERSETITLSNSVPGWNEGWIEIKNEVMTPDNKAFFSYYIEAKPKIGLFSDHPLDHSFRIVLDMYKGNEGNIFNLQEESFSANELNNYTFYIVNLNQISEKMTDLLNKMSALNKKALILTDPSMTPDNLQRLHLSEAVPKEFSQAQPITFSNIHHPILNLFDDRSLKKLRITPARNLLLKDNGNILIQSQDIPVLLETRHLVLNLDLKKAGDGFTVNPVFPILFYRIFQYMSDVEFTDILKPVGSYAVLTDGTVAQGKEKALNLKNGRYLFAVPGLYRVKDKDQEEKSISVNIENFNESAYQRIATHKSGNIRYLNQHWKNEILLSRLGLEIWKGLFLLVLILIILEMIIIKREENRSKV